MKTTRNIDETDNNNNYLITISNSSSNKISCELTNFENIIHSQNPPTSKSYFNRMIAKSKHFSYSKKHFFLKKV